MASGTISSPYRRLSASQLMNVSQAFYNPGTNGGVEVRLCSMCHCYSVEQQCIDHFQRVSRGAAVGLPQARWSFGVSKMILSELH